MQPKTTSRHMVCYILRPLERILKPCLWVCIIICIICLCKVITPFQSIFLSWAHDKQKCWFHIFWLPPNMIWNQQLGQMAQQKKTSTFDKVERFSKHNLLLLQGIVPSLCVYLFNVTHTSNLNDSGSWDDLEGYRVTLLLCKLSLTNRTFPLQAL